MSEKLYRREYETCGEYVSTRYFPIDGDYVRVDDLASWAANPHRFVDKHGIVHEGNLTRIEFDGLVNM